MAREGALLALEPRSHGRTNGGGADAAAALAAGSAVFRTELAQSGQTQKVLLEFNTDRPPQYPHALVWYGSAPAGGACCATKGLWIPTPPPVW